MKGSGILPQGGRLQPMVMEQGLLAKTLVSQETESKFLLFIKKIEEKRYRLAWASAPSGESSLALVSSPFSNVLWLIRWTFIGSIWGMGRYIPLISRRLFFSIIRVASRRESSGTPQVESAPTWKMARNYGSLGRNGAEP